MVPTPAPTIPRDDPKSWAPVIESLLSSLDKFPVQRKSRSVRKPSAGPSEWERELPEMATFLQDALEGLRGEFLASLDHPINTACRGDLCPRPQQLQRAAAGSAPPSPR